MLLDVKLNERRWINRFARLLLALGQNQSLMRLLFDGDVIGVGRVAYE